MIEESDVEAVESRSIDSGYEVLQVLVVTSECHVDESREEKTCERRWTLASLIGAR
jgi:hypothetical protein